MVDQNLDNTVIILNGTSSAGKSSIAKALQKEFLKEAKPYLHFQMDTIWQMMPQGTSLQDFSNMPDVVINSANAAVQAGNNVIIDLVCPKTPMNKLTQCFNKQSLFMVAVKADIESLAQREKERGDREIGLAESQIKSTHEGIHYDYTLDTSNLTPSQSAKAIIKALQIK